MGMLRTVAAADGLHVLHPEMVGIGADGVNGLLEADFDFEAPAVKADDLQRYRVKSVQSSTKRPRLGWITQTKRTNRPRGRQIKSSV